MDQQINTFSTKWGWFKLRGYLCIWSSWWPNAIEWDCCSNEWSRLINRMTNKLTFFMWNNILVCEMAENGRWAEIIGLWKFIVRRNSRSFDTRNSVQIRRSERGNKPGFGILVYVSNQYHKTLWKTKSSYRSEGSIGSWLRTDPEVWSQQSRYSDRFSPPELSHKSPGTLPIVTSHPQSANAK
jgi:hypothetical protein